ncbi:hypothetical protein [Thauera aromatica]|uniref:hypothetical protein n=1 Tax=Thauera aromatica TaxID=59405 RepID=UPI001FFD67CA|nr:hypothetical protein [Thauera aromatica]
MLSWLKRWLESSAAAAPAATSAGGNAPPIPDADADEYFEICADERQLASLLRRAFDEKRNVSLLPLGFSKSLTTRITAINPSRGTVSVLAHPDEHGLREQAMAAGQMQLAIETHGEHTLLALEAVELKVTPTTANYVLRLPAWALRTRFRRYPRIRLNALRA